MWENDIAGYIEESFKVINKYLGISTELIVSSNLKKDCSLKGQDKVLQICGLLGATEYYNAVGGQELYSFDAFEKHGIKLKFLNTKEIIYDQFGQMFQPNLSIIDVMMFNSVEEIMTYLNEFELIEK